MISNFETYSVYVMHMYNYCNRSQYTCYNCINNNMSASNKNFSNNPQFLLKLIQYWRSTERSERSFNVCENATKVQAQEMLDINEFTELPEGVILKTETYRSLIETGLKLSKSFFLLCEEFPDSEKNIDNQAFMDFAKEKLNAIDILSGFKISKKKIKDLPEEYYQELTENFFIFSESQYRDPKSIPVLQNAAKKKKKATNSLKKIVDEGKYKMKAKRSIKKLSVESDEDSDETSSKRSEDTEDSDEEENNRTLASRKRRKKNPHYPEKAKPAADPIDLFLLSKLKGNEVKESERKREMLIDSLYDFINPSQDQLLEPLETMQVFDEFRNKNGIQSHRQVLFIAATSYEVLANYYKPAPRGEMLTVVEELKSLNAFKTFSK